MCNILKRLCDSIKMKSPIITHGIFDDSKNDLKRLSEIYNIKEKPAFTEVNFEYLFQTFIEFSIPTFAAATVQSSLKKAVDEIDEVKLALRQGHDPLDEYVDSIMCLLDSAARHGITIVQLKLAFLKKLAINQNRVWEKNYDNTYSHVKQHR